MSFILENLQNLLNPSILFFTLGLIAQLIKSDLKLPPELVKSLTIYLLVSIGIHGGVELAHSEFSGAIPSILIAILMGLTIPLICYAIITKIGKIDPYNAVAVAAHYGSVSAGTFLTAIAFLEASSVSYEKYPIVMLAIMESPAILVGLFLSTIIRQKQQNQAKSPTQTKHILRESLTNGSIVLLIGGLIIGDITPDKSLKVISPFFNEIFMGVLCLFLLSMGMEAGKKLKDFSKAGPFLVGFGIIMPLILGLIGVVIAIYILDFSVGGATLVAVLAASASYIAVPPAMRISVPEANPSIYLTLSLGVTFPFNVMFGISIYYNFATWLLGA